ncbi:glycoside hydrolase family 3 C-terminal domain-containing protein [Pendulispora brunnea]|uniref:Glycoside hydrolase family 3 C-terminal domain-containing protein n=1 Tax=Pendulispora brunnea TaxID=2905690 RepID=A0ABZ2KN55_9BACT
MRRTCFRYTAIALTCSTTLAMAACSDDDAAKGPGPADAAPIDSAVTDAAQADAEIDVDALAERRVALLLAQMTTDEKIQLVHGTGMPSIGWGTFPPEALSGAGYIPGIPRLGIPKVSMADSTSGVNVKNARVTALPSTLALAASWDPQLAQEYGKRIAIELRTLGYEEGLGGGINLAREPRGGRTFEYLGEDPVLSGLLVAARTTGTRSQKVIATVKHYAMNNQETNRMSSNSLVDERTMRETELLAFEIGVKEGKPGSVMCAYNKINGTYACENPYLMNDVLKTEWGFKGVVQSDWGATHSTSQAATAGLDEEQPGCPDESMPACTGRSFFNGKLKEAVTNGSVPMARLDDMVKRKLRALIQAGIVDAPPTPGGAIDEAAGNAFALTAAQQSTVLLKNAKPAGSTENALPLAAGSLSSIVVIGGHADAGVLSGGGSGAVPPIDGNAVTGCQSPPTSPVGRCATWYKSAPLAAIKAKAPKASVTYFDGNDAAAAAEAAAHADVAIVFATQWETEHLDLPSLSLPDAQADPYNQSYDQNALIGAVAAKAKRIIVVLESGSPVLMPWLDHVHAVLEAWYPGVRGGQAIADVLFGDISPSGKLPLSFPKQDADLPQPVISSDLDVKYSEGLLIGYRWFDAKAIEPLFPFGHGLSYTTFSYSGIDARAESLSGNVTVKLTVSNTGTRAGTETVQVYATLPPDPVEPPKRLVAWQKVSLQPGRSEEIRISFPAKRLATWDVATHAWKINRGTYTFTAATSSRDPHGLSKSVNY